MEKKAMKVSVAEYSLGAGSLGAGFSGAGFSGAADGPAAAGVLKPTKYVSHNEHTLADEGHG